MAVALLSACGGSSFADGGRDDGGPADAGQTDAGVSCPTGQTECAGACVDTGADPGHCGSCLRACGAGFVCARGSCWMGSAPPVAGGMGGGDGGIVPLTTCTIVSAPGVYVLQNDLGEPPDAGACLQLLNTRDVTVDCAGHSVDHDLFISGVDSFQIENCHFANASNSEITASSHGVVSASTFDSTASSSTNEAVLVLWQVSALSLSGCHFDVAGPLGPLEVFDATTTAITDDVFALTNDGGCSSSDLSSCSLIGEAIFLGGGQGNVVARNTIQGSWDGTPALEGTDDGIVVSDESNDVFDANVISDVFDTGIETGGTVSGTRFSGNLVTHSGWSGLGGWYEASVDGCTFVGNVIQQSPALLYFSRACGLESDSPQVVFRDNLISGNSLASPALSTFAGSASCTAPQTGATYLPLFDQMGYTASSDSAPQCGPLSSQTQPTAQDYLLTGNVFAANDFGHECLAPFFGANAPVPGAVVDGSGNRCLAPASASYPLACQ